MKHKGGEERPEKPRNRKSGKFSGEMMYERSSRKSLWFCMIIRNTCAKVRAVKKLQDWSMIFQKNLRIESFFYCISTFITHWDDYFM